MALCKLHADVHGALGGVFSVFFLVGALGTCMARWAIFSFARCSFSFARCSFSLPFRLLLRQKYLTTPRLHFHHVQHIPGHTNGSQHSFRGRRKQHW
jgi:hypothetical protein